MIRIAIIAAMDRELAPLVRDWNPISFTVNGQSFQAYEDGERVAVAGGIGSLAAQAVARAVVAQYKPQLLISAGLAGALIYSLKVGSVITPNVIVDAATGTEYRSPVGGGVLVTANEVATSTSKPKLVDKFHALAVDMEAAAVAQVARQEGINFRCVKSISDEAGFVMPPLSRFVDANGKFQTGRFASWAAIRPWEWPRVIALGRNTGRACQALCDWLRNNGQPSMTELGCCANSREAGSGAGNSRPGSASLAETDQKTGPAASQLVK